MSSLMLGHKDVFLWTVHDQLRSSTTKKPYQGSDQDSRSSDHPTPSVPIIAHIPLQIASLLFADEVVLIWFVLFQHSADRFAECEAAGMRIGTSKSQAMGRSTSWCRDTWPHWYGKVSGSPS